MPTDVAIHDLSDQSVLISFGSEFDAANYSRVLGLFRCLRREQVKGVTNLHPAYHSLLIEFDALSFSHDAVRQIALDRLNRGEEGEQSDQRTVEIPVHYGAEFGPDLPELARMHDLSERDVIDLHAGETYTVYFLGFVPGFAYLGMVPEQIATPRLPAPRKQVPAGSVGIADRQTGVYPIVTPGGWRLIGRTSLAMFDSGSSLLEPGDLVRFRPISQ